MVEPFMDSFQGRGKLAVPAAKRLQGEFRP